MGRWVKHYSDGTLYSGTDKDVSNGKASWRNSRQGPVVCVCLEHDDARICISGLGEYWQSDGYVSSLSGSHSLIHRRIMRKITKDDLFLRSMKTKYTYTVEVVTNPALLLDKDLELIPAEWKDKWLVVEYDVQDGYINSFIRDDKY